MDLKNIDHFTSWKEFLLQPNQSDVLVTILPGKNALALNEQAAVSWKDEVLFIPINTFTTKLVQQYKKTIKDSAVHAIGLANGVIDFELDSKKYSCPLVLTNGTIKKNRIRNCFEFNFIEDAYLNPFLENLLGSSFFPVVDDILGVLNDIGLKYTFHDASYLGNFNPHRFVLLKELEELEIKLPSQNINALLFGEKEQAYKLPMLEGDLVALDPDQKLVTEEIVNNNLVVQGPPGTGKSHVISNIISKVDGASIVLTEKKVALEVVYKHLMKQDLHHFALMCPHQIKAKDLNESLKSSWRFLEQINIGKANFFKHSSLILNQLDFVLARLNEPGLIGGYSYAEFQTKKPKFKKTKYNYLGNLTLLPDWEEEKRMLACLSDDLILKLSEVGFNIQIKNELENFKNELKKALVTINVLNAGEWTFHELTQMQRKSALVCHFFYDGHLLPDELVRVDSEAYTSFFKTYNTLSSVRAQIAMLEEEKENWSKTFNLTELYDYIRLLASPNKFNLRDRIKRRELKKYAKLDILSAKEGLERLVKLKKLEQDVLDLETELILLGLPNDESSLKTIALLLKELASEDQLLIKELQQLSKQEKVSLRNNVHHLRELGLFLNRSFINVPSGKIGDYLINIQENFNLLFKHEKVIKTLSDSTKEVLSTSASIEEANELIFKSHWDRFVGRYPELANYSADDFVTKLNDYISTEEKEVRDFATFYKARQKEKWERYHLMLQTPANKLTSDEKELKKQLRKGKSILVKNFAKSRNHLSLKDLLSSEARIWIELLHPIMLMSPQSLAKSMPMEERSIDLLVIDEASQMPLMNAVGGIFRAKRTLVVGDEHQMSPSHYFQSSSILEETILHQATYYWKKVGLSFHYRAQHPLLMRYSNKFFYNDKLSLFPSPLNYNPIKLITIDGVFDEGKNVKEAKEVVQILNDELKQDESVGLVTFNQRQLEEINSRLSTRQHELFSKNENWMQSLENVQGDQCDHLIISLGYGYNQEGNFYKRFGPLSSSHGRKRLNVLMSRAQKKITFIRSVDSTDFPISDKQGVEALRSLMLYLEQVCNGPHKDDDIHIFKKVEINADELVVRQFFEQAFSASTFVAYYKTLLKRGWNVKLKLN